MLTKSDRQRDLNILEASVREAARHLRDDELSNALDAHFQLNSLNQESRKRPAGGCTIASLLHQMGHDFHPVLATRSRKYPSHRGKTAGLEWALRHVAAKQNASHKLMPTWVQTTPAPCSTGSWATQASDSAYFARAC